MFWEEMTVNHTFLIPFFRPYGLDPATLEELIEFIDLLWYNVFKKGGGTMANDQHMIDTLSDMLQDGETLMCPIFGYVKISSFSQFAYFGFTETHFLIAYLSGMQVTDTIRIPLDITSVQIKKSKLFKEHIIDIIFENGKEYTICAYPKVLKVKLQEENFPLFLALLRKRSKRQALTLDEISGEKIRWQYFNTYVYTMLASIPAVPAMIIMQELRKGNFDIWNTVVEMSGAIPVLAVMYGIFVGPFIVLSLLNRFTFGKPLGVITDDALFLENRELPLRNIVKIIYHPRVMSRSKISFSYATFVVQSNNNGTKSFDVTHFPMYGLKKIKKYNKEIKLSCDKYIWFLILCPTVIFAIIGFLFG